jgi:hypothetical protein
VAFRLAADHANAVSQLVLLDVPVVCEQKEGLGGVTPPG